MRPSRRWSELVGTSDDGGGGRRRAFWWENEEAPVVNGLEHRGTSGSTYHSFEAEEGRC